MTTTTIAVGTKIVILDAEGTEHEAEALSAIETEGHIFPVVWVARPLSHGGTDRVPWPLEAVRPSREAQSND